MGLRFRKSFGSGPVRFNFSKSGIGASIGVKGARLTRTATGRSRSTLSIPGTGISYVTEGSGKKGKKSKAAPNEAELNDRLFGYGMSTSGYCVLSRVAGVSFLLLNLVLLLIQMGGGSVAPLFLFTVPVMLWFFFVSPKRYTKKKAAIEEAKKDLPCGVRNKETGEVFATLEAAAASIGQTSSASISRSIGQGTKAGGYHWEIVTKRQLEDGN